MNSTRLVLLLCKHTITLQLFTSIVFEIYWPCISKESPTNDGYNDLSSKPVASIAAELQFFAYFLYTMTYMYDGGLSRKHRYYTYKGLATRITTIRQSSLWSRELLRK